MKQNISLKLTQLYRYDFDKKQISGLFFAQQLDQHVILNNAKITPDLISQQIQKLSLYTLKPNIVLRFKQNECDLSQLIKLYDLTVFQLDQEQPVQLQTTMINEFNNTVSNKIEFIQKQISQLEWKQEQLNVLVKQQENLLFNKFKEQLEKVTQLSQFGVNYYQTEILKLSNEIEKYEKMKNLIDKIDFQQQKTQNQPDSLLYQSGDNTALNILTLNKINNQPVESMFYTYPAVSSNISPEFFAPIIKNETIITAAHTEDLTKQFYGMQAMLNEDYQQMLNTKMSTLQKQIDIEQTTKVKDVMQRLQDSISLMKQNEEEVSKYNQSVRAIDLKNENEQLKKQIEEEKRKHEEHTRKLKQQAEETKIPYNPASDVLQGSEINKKSNAVIKHFQEMESCQVEQLNSLLDPQIQSQLLPTVYYHIQKLNQNKQIFKMNFEQIDQIEENQDQFLYYQTENTIYIVLLINKAIKQAEIYDIRNGTFEPIEEVKISDGKIITDQWQFSSKNTNYSGQLENVLNFKMFKLTPQQNE